MKSFQEKKFTSVTFKINITSMTFKNELALHICHNSQCHLIQYSLDTVPPSCRPLWKQRAKQWPRNKCRLSNYFKLINFRLITTSKKTAIDFDFDLSGCTVRRFRFIPIWNRVRNRRRIFHNPKNGGRGRGLWVFFFKGICLHGTEQSHALKAAPEPEAVWHVSTALL